MTDHEFLAWLHDRLVFVYHESPNMDFVQRLRRIVDGMAPKLCGERMGVTGMFVCNERDGHDGNHRMTGDNIGASWPQGEGAVANMPAGVIDAWDYEGGRMTTYQPRRTK